MGRTGGSIVITYTSGKNPYRQIVVLGKEKEMTHSMSSTTYGKSARSCSFAYRTLISLLVLKSYRNAVGPFRMDRKDKQDKVGFF